MIEKQEIVPPLQEGEKSFAVEDTNVRVSWRIFEPSQKNAENEKVATLPHATIFLMGWGMSEKSASLQSLSQSFADANDGQVYAISTKPESVRANSLYEEAQAIMKLLEEKKLHDVTIIGYSEGGVKAVNLASLLKAGNMDKELDQQIGVDGVVLLDPAGLDQRDPVEFTRKFIADSLFTTIRDTMSGKPQRQILQRLLTSGTDIVFGMMAEIKKYGRQYPQRIRNQLREIISLNPRLAEVTVPVVLVRGNKDPVTESLAGQGDRQVNEALQELFAKSPYVRTIEAEKLGHHTLPILRDQEVAVTTRYMLNRFWRNTEIGPRLRPQARRISA